MRTANLSIVAATILATASLASANLIIYEGFNYPLATNAPDPDGGANGGNGLPATNVGGNPAGTSTGFRGTWGTTMNVASGLSYAQGSKVLDVTGGAGAPNNATWGTDVFAYRFMTADPFLSQRVGGANNGNFGVDSSTLYVSLLGRTTSSTSQSFRILLGGTRNVFLENTASGWSLNENAAGAVPTNAPVALNQTTLFVVKIDFVAGIGDVLNLYVDPALGQPLGTPNATLTTVGGSFAFGGINTRPTVLNAMTVDEFRLGTTLASVTPHVVPEPASLGLLALAATAMLRRRSSNR